MWFSSSHQLLSLFLFLLPTTLSQQPKPPYQCDETFSFFNADIAIAANLTHCRKLPAMSAELAWNLHNNTFITNKTNSTTIDFLFSIVPISSSGWVAWGVNPGPKPQMVGTRAIVGIGDMGGGDGSVVVATYNVTAQVKLGCKLVNTTVEFSVKNLRSSYSAATGRVVVAGRLELPAAEYDVRRLNHVWQVGPAAAGMVLLPHRLRLQNFDSVETLDLVTGRKAAGHSSTVLRDVSINCIIIEKKCVMLLFDVSVVLKRIISCTKKIKIL